MLRVVLFGFIISLGVHTICRSETITVVPTHASGSFTVNGNEITLLGGGQHVFLELFMSDWDIDLDGIPRLSGYNVRVNDSSLSSGLQGTLHVSRRSCDSQNDCDAIWGNLGPTCRHELCSGAFSERTARTDHIFFGNTTASCEETFNPRWGCSIGGPPYALDSGADKYIGTLTLRVPPDALGTFTIDLNQHDGGFQGGYLLDEFGNLSTPPINVAPALITVVASGIPAGDSCLAAIDPSDAGYNPVCSLPGDLVCTVPYATNVGADLDGPVSIRGEFGQPVPVTADVWYPYMAACSGTMTVNTCAPFLTTLDLVVGIYHDSASPLACVCPLPDFTGDLLLLTGADETCDGISNGGPAFLTQSVISGECYTIRIAGFDELNVQWREQGGYFLEITCFSGERVSVPTGTNVTSSVNGGSTATGGVDVSFDSTDAAGEFSADYMLLDDADAILGDAEFKASGDPTQAWNISFTGSFSGSVEITFSYDPALLTVPEPQLRIYHNVQGAWTELPFVSRNLLANTITVTTTSFSLFALGIDLNAPAIPTVSEWNLITMGLLMLVGATVVLRRRLVLPYVHGAQSLRMPKARRFRKV